MTKRSFFRRFGAIIAAVALAPEIAFGAKLDLPTTPPLDLQEMIANVYSMLRARKVVDTMDIYTDRLGVAAIEQWAVMGVDMKKCGTVGIANFRSPSLGILEQLQAMPRPTVDNSPRPPVFCKDCGKEGMDLCMSCYDARIDDYNASV